MLLHSLLIEPLGWTLIRIVSGFCMAGLFVVAESWLNGASRDATRGRILAIYMVVVTGGLAVGQDLRIMLRVPVTLRSPYQLLLVDNVSTELFVDFRRLTVTRAPMRLALAGSENIELPPIVYFENDIPLNFRLVGADGGELMVDYYDLTFTGNRISHTFPAHSLTQLEIPLKK